MIILCTYFHHFLLIYYTGYTLWLPSKAKKRNHSQRVKCHLIFTISNLNNEWKKRVKWTTVLLWNKKSIESHTCMIFDFELEL